MPIEHFLVDPPITDVPDSVIPLGVKILPREQTCNLCLNKIPIDSSSTMFVADQFCPKCHGTGKITVYHVWDQVGLDNYPNVLDFVKEVEFYGLSRKIPKTADFSLLTEDSRWIGVHARAHVDNIGEWYDSLRDSWYCPKNKSEHRLVEDEDVCCAGFWWQDITEGDPVGGSYYKVTRHLPSFEYSAYARPDGIEPQYRRAIFISLPLSRLVVVRGQKHEQTLRDMQRSRLPCEVVEE
jgi:hypothetical protein